MHSLSRREFLVATGAGATAVALGAPSVQAQKRGGTLRFVPHADLKVLDPIWTTAYITRNHGYMVYDTLFATDVNLQIKPQMVDKYSLSKDRLKWSFTLRDGLRFHDGQLVTAEDCVVSLQRWGKKDPLGKLLLAATAKLQAADKKTFVLELAEPFGLVLEALGKPSSNVPFIMPARVAATSENEQIKEPIGSGPYKLVKEEWQPGHQVVYVRNPDYVPRNEPPNGATGGKRVYIDRVIWRYIPDAATANAALEAGEVDYWEYPAIDFVPRLEKNPSLTLFVIDSRGNQGWLRPNHLHPPFNNKKARQALLHLMNQEMCLQAAAGLPKYYRVCPAYFMCGPGMPYETGVGAPPKPDLQRAKQLMREAGYDGRPVVLLDPTDYPSIHAPALVVRELLTQIGVNVDLQAMDWSTLISRRADKKPPQEGGWNLFTTWAISADVMTPAVNHAVGGGCDKAWFGWPCVPEIEKLKSEWIRATDLARRKQLAVEIQKIAYEEVPYVSWGQFVQPSVYRKTVRGVLQFACAILWNIAIEA